MTTINIYSKEQIDALIGSWTVRAPNNDWTDIFQDNSGLETKKDLFIKIGDDTFYLPKGYNAGTTQITLNLTVGDIDTQSTPNTIVTKKDVTISVSGLASTETNLYENVTTTSFSINGTSVEIAYNTTPTTIAKNTVAIWTK